MQNNQSISDIGVIIGCLGTDGVKWLKDLKKECSSIDEFLELAAQRADIALIAAAAEAAVGYDFTEEEIEYIKVVDGENTDGSPRVKEVEGKRKVRKRHARKNDSLLKFILKNRSPEYFQDISKVEVNKKSVEIKQITESEIKKFAGRLLESVKDKKDE